MSERDLARDALALEPAGPDEAEQASRLAAALDGRPSPGVDREALAVAFLLQAVAAAGAGDEVAAARFRRLERELRAGARRRRLLGAAAAAVAALVVGVAAFSSLHRRPPTMALLEERERAAQVAVRALLAEQPALDAVCHGVTTRRQSELLATVRSEHFERLRRSLLEERLEPSSEEVTRPTPTLPGGRTS